VRLGIVHNIDVEAVVRRSAAGHLCISCAIDVALATLDVGVAKMFVTKLVKEENVDALKSGAKTWEDLAVSVSDSLVITTSRFVKTILMPFWLHYLFTYLFIYLPKMPVVF